MREVTLRVRHHGEPECEMSMRHPDVTLKSVSSMTGRADERKRIVQISGDPDDIKSFLEDFRDAGAILEADPVSPLGEPRVLVAITVDLTEWDSISERLSDMSIHYRVGTTIRNGWERWTLYLSKDDDLSSVIDTLESAGNTVRLVRDIELSEVDRPPSLGVTEFLEQLTRRQQTVLAAAINLGYYDHQGGVSLDHVANELDLSRTTVWEHLSRAEEKVMYGLADRLHR